MRLCVGGQEGRRDGLRGRTDGGLCEIGGVSYPLEGVAKRCERVCKALDVASAVVEQIEAHRRGSVQRSSHRIYRADLKFVFQL